MIRLHLTHSHTYSTVQMTAAVFANVQQRPTQLVILGLRFGQVGRMGGLGDVSPRLQILMLLYQPAWGCSESTSSLHRFAACCGLGIPRPSGKKWTTSSLPQPHGLSPVLLAYFLRH